MYLIIHFTIEEWVKAVLFFEINTEITFYAFFRCVFYFSNARSLF